MNRVLTLVILTLLIALAGGAVKTFQEIRLILDHPPIDVLLQVIVNIQLLLVLVGVFNTTLTYFREGRIKVIFIVDTILVVMLIEIISQWFIGEDGQRQTALCGMVLILGIIGVIAGRWSPTPIAGKHDAMCREL